MTSDMPDVTMVSDAASLGLPAGEGSASLVMIYGDYLGRRFQIGTGPLVIGRAPECSVHISDDSVSRQHCHIAPSERNMVLKDLKSTNGTYVNGTAVSARPLRDGDKIQVGRSIFKFITGQNIEQAYHEEIYRLKTVDGLTGAVNKRTFEEELRRELQRFFRYGRSLALIMIDIDHFKNVNDTWGHLAGDRILSELGQLIGGKVRREETFCRYGGEEFALILPEKEHEGAVQMAEDIRHSVEAHLFDFDDIRIPVTISAGVTQATDRMEGPDDFVAEADRLLYLAKGNGRNRVESGS